MTAQVTVSDRTKLAVGGSAYRLRVPVDRPLVDVIRLLICVALAVLGLAGLVGMGMWIGADALPAEGPAPGMP